MLKSEKETTDIHWQCSICKTGYYKRPDECEVCGLDLFEALESEPVLETILEGL